jgi:hypothetical protein
LILSKAGVLSGKKENRTGIMISFKETLKPCGKTQKLSGKQKRIREIAKASGKS